MAAGNTFAPEGEIFEQLGSTLQHPADQPSLLSMAQCAALCNDSSLQYAAGGAGCRLGGRQLLSWWLHARLLRFSAADRQQRAIQCIAGNADQMLPLHVSFCPVADQ